LEENEMDFDGFEPEQIETTETLLEYFDKLYTEALNAFTNAKDEVLEEYWSMKDGDEVYMTLPKKQILRIFCMNHLVHHRAQLGVYLRLLNIEIPATYGPSADDYQVSMLDKF
jgi:uncharacterized damage-inducible protein DinB